jgi:hypothetical protein
MSTENKDKIKRWQNYIRELFDDRKSKQKIHNETGMKILQAEVDNTITTMKRGKAAGPDNIHIEKLH